VGPGPRSGAASVEHVAMAAMLALLIAAAVAALANSPPDRGARELGEMLGRRIACVPRHPVPCGRNPLAAAYGFAVGKSVRALAPGPVAALGTAGPLLPVDFRHCRRASCAMPGLEPGLTASNRRVTYFVEVEDLRRSAGQVRITYWAYRPTLGWEAVVRTAGSEQVASAGGLTLSVEDVPALVPLETLPGRNHARFPAGEEPPWRWRVTSP
jgi:hypothetical protein